MDTPSAILFSPDERLTTAADMAVIGTGKKFLCLFPNHLAIDQDETRNATLSTWLKTRTCVSEGVERKNDM
jgi:hypothetical protein